MAQSTEDARKQPLQSGPYSRIDTAGAGIRAAKGPGLRNCRGCAAAIALELEADQSPIGVVTKISMAEYVVDLQVRDARTGAVVSRFTTGLRMGAHDAWFRGVRSLMRHLPCPQSIQVRKTVQVRAMAQIDPEGPLWRHRVLSAGHSWPLESHRVRHFARPIQNFRTFVIMVTGPDSVGQHKFLCP